MAKKTTSKPSTKKKATATASTKKKKTKRKACKDGEVIDGRDGFAFGGTCGMDE